MTGKTNERCLDCGFYMLGCVCESEQKTYDSVPITPEEFKDIQDNLYSEDIKGGLQNIEIPEESYEEISEQYNHAESFIDMKEVDNTPCYKTDRVHLKLTPEKIQILLEILKNYNMSFEDIPYLKDFDSWKQHDMSINLRYEVEETLDEYIRHRPYNPLLPNWFKRIGKENVDKEKNL